MRVRSVVWKSCSYRELTVITLTIDKSKLRNARVAVISRIAMKGKPRENYFFFP